jgi:hypothetical protein
MFKSSTVSIAITFLLPLLIDLAAAAPPLRWDGCRSPTKGGRATGTVSNNVTHAQPSWFVNAAAGDLHLVAIATAAIDKAAVHPSVPTDYDAETRPQGTVPDIGADEFSLGSLPPEAPTNVRVLP